MMISKFALNNVMKHGDDNNSSTCQLEYIGQIVWIR